VSKDLAKAIQLALKMDRSTIAADFAKIKMFVTNIDYKMPK